MTRSICFLHVLRLRIKSLCERLTHTLKALYGLIKQAPHVWYERLTHTLYSSGSLQTAVILHFLYIFMMCVTLYALLYVDDILITDSFSHSRAYLQT